MIHSSRLYGITEVDRATLLEKLTNHSWTLCTGFLCEGFYWFNDACTADSAQEYAVFKDGIQIESITVSWCEAEELEKYIDQIHDGANHMPMKAEEPQHGVSAKHGTCRLCR